MVAERHGGLYVGTQRVRPRQIKIVEEEVVTEEKESNEEKSSVSIVGWIG